jgi:Peptidase A4 family
MNRLKRYLSAVALLLTILSLTALAPHASLPATSAKSANATRTAVATAGPAKVHRSSELTMPGFTVTHGHNMFLPNNNPAASSDNATWSGYVDTACTTCHLRYIGSSFTVPIVQCAYSSIGTGGAYADVWVGLDASPSVEQIGVQTSCSSTKAAPVYKLFYEMFPTNANPIYPAGSHPISGGDSVAVSVYYDQSTTAYTMTFVNKTKGYTYTTPSLLCISGTCNNKTAEAIVEDPGGGVPTYDLDDFEEVPFSSTTVTSFDGTKGDLCTYPGLWTEARIDMVDPNGNDMAVPTAIIPCPATSPDGFTDNWVKGS